MPRKYTDSEKDTLFSHFVGIWVICVHIIPIIAIIGGAIVCIYLALFSHFVGIWVICAHIMSIIAIICGAWVCVYLICWYKEKSL